MEKRRVRRVEVDLKVSIRQGKQVAQGRAKQFSEYGMLVEPSEVGQAGQRYDLSFALPGHRAHFRLKGIAVYATGKGVGIRFEHVPRETTGAFRSYIQGLSATANSA